MNVRFGSKADILSDKFHVRFTPESGHKTTQAGMSALCQKRTLISSDWSVCFVPGTDLTVVGKSQFWKGSFQRV
jgi:hypothetical protein